MQNNHVDLQGGDEIDLMELARGIFVQKWLILVVTLLVAIGATAYAFLSKPVYEAKLFIIPPTQNGIAELNYGRGKARNLILIRSRTSMMSLPETSKASPFDKPSSIQSIFRRLINPSVRRLSIVCMSDFLVS